MAYELIFCPDCNRTTLNTWQCDYLDAEEEGQKEFYLICAACGRITKNYDKTQPTSPEIVKNRTLGDVS